VEAEAKRKKVEKNRKKKAKKKKKLAEKEAAAAGAADSARVATIVAEAPEPEPQPEPELEPQPEPEPEPEPDEPTAAPERVFSFDSLGADQQRSRPSQAVFQFRAGKTVERESAAAAAAGAQPEPQPQPQQVSEPKPKPDDGTAELRAKFDAGVEQWSAAQVVQWVALQAELLPAGSTQLVTAAFESLGAEGNTHSSAFQEQAPAAPKHNQKPSRAAQHNRQQVYEHMGIPPDRLCIRVRSPEFRRKCRL
jgi:hypothetical protein